MSATPSKEVTTKQIRSVRFGFYSDEEVRRMSVKQIVQPVIFDNLKNVVPGGLYDSALGPIDARGRCGTCSLPQAMCPGHFGHIQLPVPVYNPIIFNNMYKILRQQCHFCYKLRMDREEVARFERKLTLLVSGRLTDAAAMQVARGTPPKELEQVLEGSEKMPDAFGLFNEGTTSSSGNQRLAPTLTSHTLEAIQDTIADFFARVPKGRCRNCEAHSPNIKRQGYMRLFKVWGSAKAVMQNLKTGKVTRSVLQQQHTQQKGGFSSIEDEMAESLQQQQAKRRAAASKGKASKRQKQGDEEDTKPKKEEDEDGEEEWGNEEDEEDEDGQKEGLEALVEEGAQGYQSAEQKREEKAMKQAEEDEWEYGMTREDTMADGPATKEDIDLRPKYMTPLEAEELLRRLWQQEWRLIALIFGPGSELAEALPGTRSNKGLAGATTPAPFTSLNWSKEAEARIKQGYQMFFVHTLPVVPNKFRPPSRVGEDMFEHPQNVALMRILTACLDINSAQQTAATPEQLQHVVQPEQVKAMEMGRMLNTWLQLQDAVAGLMDATLSEKASADKQQGIRQVLEKKEGLFRKNMMGKRVNYAARSVISPDPYIGAGEIGVPPYFAKRLCFPEKVTPWNVERLRQAILRGANEPNGAVAVEDERGRVVQLERMDRQKREGLAKALLSSTASGGKQMRGVSAAASMASSRPAAFQAPNKTVFRHLQDGDIMLTNRQPTLHKPGLMAHRARVLKGEKTIRLHYANCSTFNADFDGDEINLHMPQDHYGRAEGALIVHADHQFIVPTDGKPLRGLIQDHVVSGVLLMKRDTWLTKAQYTQLVYIACNAWQSGSAKSESQHIDLELPSIMKPRMLWSGKQVVSTAVSYYTRGQPPLTFSGGGKVPADYWGGKQSGEAELVFHKGYLVSGCVDKASYGKYGLVHAIQELYGPRTAGLLTNCFSRLFTAYMQWHGFTCGFDDLLLDARAEKQRKVLLDQSEAIAIRASAEFVGLTFPEQWVKEPHKFTQQLKAAEKKVSAALSSRYRANRDTGKAHDMKGSGVMHPLCSDVIKVCLPSGQIKAFPRNCLSLMTVSGAKGSLVNFSQISCVLGQQELEGRRVPRMSSGKTLPCFGEYDSGARSCGFVADRFLTGLRPQEYYFHCMAGREGLVDTTVKTSRSGYLQRCLVKNLEALRVHYDGTVRDDGDGSIVQFLYGEDGLDVTQVSYMTQKLGFLAANSQRFAQSLDLNAAAEASKVAHLQQHEMDVERAFCARAACIARARGAAQAKDGEGQRQALAEMAQQLPIMARYPASVRGAVSEAFADRLTEYLQSNPDGRLIDPESALVPAGAAIDSASMGSRGSDGKKKKKREKQLQMQLAAGAVDARKFCSLMQLKYMRALAAPGEAVGVICAQSLGEPSTQMTLNTFHSAGQGGAANVTLGIPRLREILMTAAAKIKTPVMTLPLRPGLTFAHAQELGGRLRKLRLGECLAGISVQETPVTKDLSKGYVRRYTATLQFFGPAQYPPEYKLSFKELAETFAGPFCAKLKQEVEKEVRKKGGGSGSSASLRIGKMDLSSMQGEEGAAGRAGTNAGGDEGEGAEDAGGERAANKRPRDDLDEDEDEPGEEDEQNEEMREGKQRFRGGNDETTYDAPDEEDQEAAATAALATRRRGLGSQAEGSEDTSEEGADEQQGAAEPSGREGEGEEEAAGGEAQPKKGRKQAKVEDGKGGAKGAKSKAEKGSTGVSSLSDPGSGVDYASHSCSVTINLPLKAPKLLLLEVVEKVAANVMVRATPNVEKVYVLQGERGEGPKVQTDGINLEGVWEHGDLVDLNSLQTNDIAAMLHTYGVEAARATILNEVTAVFGAYGIAVDPRHLCLLADFMTQQGSYRACNRIGIETSVSPFLKMSFETAAHFLTEATLKASVDDMRTPSARLCMGQVVELGTGVMGIMQHLG